MPLSGCITAPVFQRGSPSLDPCRDVFCRAPYKAEFPVAWLSNLHRVDVHDVSAGARSHDWNLGGREDHSRSTDRKQYIATSRCQDRLLPRRCRQVLPEPHYPRSEFAITARTARRFDPHSPLAIDTSKEKSAGVLWQAKHLGCARLPCR